MKTLFLIDISSYIYRAYYAIRELSTSQGFPTNAIFGVTTMLLKVLRERQPSHLALVFDSKGPTFRHRRFPAYKAHRPGMPDDLVKQLDYLRRIIAALNLPGLELEGYEADDLIATLTRQALTAGMEVEIISGDKDLLPLAGAGVTIWDPMQEVSFTPEVIEAKYGLPPSVLVDMRALVGDPSDNIPGVPGIGVKTAQKLMARFHSLEELLAHLDEVKEKKLRERLRQYQEQARLSRELLLLDDQAPLPADVAALQPGPWDVAALGQLFAELEFSKLAKEISGGDIVGDFRLVNSLPAVQEVVAAIRAAGRLAVYCHSGPQHPMLAELVGLGLSWEDGRGVYLPFQADMKTEQIWELVGPLWNDPKIEKISPDLKIACLWGKRRGLKLAGAAGDILLASYVFNPVRFGQDIEKVALHYLGANLPQPRELAGRPMEAAELPLELAVTYAASRAEAAWRLWPRIQAELRENDLWELYEKLELPLLSVLAAMEFRGIGIDLDFLDHFGQYVEQELARLEGEIFQLAGEPFLINSPQQLAAILFERLRLPTQKKTRGRTAYSTDNEVLTALAAEHPIAAKLITYRTLGKLKATYVDGLRKQVNPSTGRIHTTFVQSAAATGRLSSREPNLQNIPVRGELGSQIRQAFIPRPDYAFISGDYSQIELRLLAHFSQDPLLLQAFREGEDIHRQTAAEVFGLHPELVSPEMRRQAKVINFGIIYGMSAFGLAKQLGVSQRLAQDFIDRYFARFAGVERYLAEVIEQARQRGWVSTIRGRRRPIPHLHSSNRNLRQESERSAVNTPLQGSAADLIKEAMLAVEAALPRQGLSGKLLLQIHDELLLETPTSEIADTVQCLRQAMEGVFHLNVPLLIDIRTGKNWGGLQPWRD
ncbi:MAG: DNA polymerase I [Deltaproteobacteria bacterium]|nr:DNA polymerase I [Deltaproteobacteria bacterium]